MNPYLNQIELGKNVIRFLKESNLKPSDNDLAIAGLLETFIKIVDELYKDNQYLQQRLNDSQKETDYYIAHTPRNCDYYGGMK